MGCRSQWLAVAFKLYVCYELLYLTWILNSPYLTSKDLLHSTGNSAQHSVITSRSPGGRMGEGTVRESGMDVDTRLYLTWRASKDLWDSAGNSAQCHVAAGMGGEFAGEWIHVHIWLSASTVQLKLRQHC